MAESKMVDRQWVMEYFKKWEPELVSIRDQARIQSEFCNEMLPKLVGIAKSAQEMIDGMKRNVEEKLEQARHEERARLAKPAKRPAKTSRPRKGRA